jgi:hypothetical protein
MFSLFDSEGYDYDRYSRTHNEAVENPNPPFLSRLLIIFPTIYSFHSMLIQVIPVWPIKLHMTLLSLFFTPNTSHIGGSLTDCVTPSLTSIAHPPSSCL